MGHATPVFSTPTEAKNVGLVYNPAAGAGKAARVARRVERCLTERGLNVIARPTQGPRTATALSRELAAQADLVVAVGGDGTVNEVVNGLAGGETPLGIVPAGTANVLAIQLGLPFAPERACDVIGAGRITRLDLGRVNGRHFTLMVGAGVDAQTVRELDPRAKERFGKLAFVWTGVRSLVRHPPPEFQATVDGRSFRVTFAVVGNCRYYGGRFALTTEADPTDGMLDVLLFTGRGFLRNLLFWLSVALRLHRLHPNTLYLRGSRVEMVQLSPEEVVWFQTDGELAGRLPATVEILKGALRVFVPNQRRRGGGDETS